MKMLKIKVVKGKKIRNPQNGGKPLTDLPANVPANSYWLKRLKEGDVEIYKDEPVKKVEIKKETKKELKKEMKIKHKENEGAE